MESPHSSLFRRSPSLQYRTGLDRWSRSSIVLDDKNHSNGPSATSRMAIVIEDTILVCDQWY